MQQIIHTTKATILAVMVPEGTKNMKISGTNWVCIDFGTGFYASQELPAGQWQLLGFRHKISQAEASLIVEESQYVPGTWKSYQEASGLMYWEQSALHSFSRLLDANECYEVNPFGEDPTSCGGKPDCCIGKRCRVLLWREAQWRTGKWAILIEVK